MQLLKSRPMGAVCAVMITSIVLAPIAASAGAEPADQKTLEEEVGPDPAKSASNPLSDAGTGGYLYYRMHCQSCHGYLGSGTKKAGPLLHTEYSKDFNKRKAFHSNFRTSDRSHLKVARGTRKRPGPGFNELEMIAKFLREIEVWHERLKDKG